MGNAGLQYEVADRLEAGDFLIAGDYQRKRGRLDSTKGQDFGFSLFPAGKRQSSGGIDTHEPVGSLSGASRIGQRSIGTVVRDAVQSFLDGAVIEGAEPEATSGAVIAAAFKDFLYQKLTFTVGVARVHRVIRLLEQVGNGLELGFRALFDGVFPFLRHDGQIFFSPPHIIRGIGFGEGGLDHMAEAPRHHIFTAAITVFFLLAAAEIFGDGLCHRRFFSNEKSHEISLFLKVDIQRGPHDMPLDSSCFLSISMRMVVAIEPRRSVSLMADSGSILRAASRKDGVFRMVLACVTGLLLSRNFLAASATDSGFTVLVKNCELS